MDYLDGRRLNFYALTTPLAEIHRVFSQLMSEHDLSDSDIRNSSQNLKTSLPGTNIIIGDIYEPHVWLNFHWLQATVIRDLIPFHLWVPLIASGFRSHISDVANIANLYN